MTADTKLIPIGSQTVGPYFGIGLTYLVEHSPQSESGARNEIEIRGRILDGNGAPVPDAMLEFWSDAATGKGSPAQLNENGFPKQFRRAMTDEDGAYRVSLPSPEPMPFGDEGTYAPRLLVLLFARGLSRHLISQVYFEDEPANASDPLLNGIAAERRPTLLARRDSAQPAVFHWDVVLQGQDETVFFAW